MIKRINVIGTVFCCLSLFISAKAQTIAFPGAEGFGQYTTGGRGGKVYVVTTLDDSGPGSLRNAVEAKEPRVVVFAVSGTIHLQSKLEIKGNITIAGQSAPGDGICLADYSVGLGGDNIIVRYMRFRMGDKNQKGGMVDGNGGDDAFGGTRRRNIIVDHCSVSWSTDEVLSVYNGDSTTLQWNLIAEPLNYSYHFEKGDTDYEHHGYGGIWGGKHFSGHHNLFAHCNSRNPRFNGNRQGIEENVDFRNNVIYDWGINSAYAGEGGNYNMVNNYYRYGPNTNKKVLYRIMNPWKNAKLPYGKFFIDGNYVDGSAEVTGNNWQGVQVGEKQADDPALAKADAPFSTVPVTTQNAKDAYELVLKNAGCSFKRDTLDARVINEVKHRGGRFVDVQGGYPHVTDYEATVHAWPTLRSLPAPADKDQDGMPDAWEAKHALDPADAGDASVYKLDKQYTNIEVYLNELVK
ncbi:MAG: polysaccharide lyase family 1 protein [Niastella sp.]|uniref:pectate lyase family protein n=1 Tax=Niastella sp. TaxID=1869183 RepID=UPI00389AF122